MASQEVTLFNNRPDLPAEAQAFFDEETNVVPRLTIPSLSYEGKIWTVSLDGKRTQLIKKNADGDDEPVSTFRAVILDYNRQRGRAYYEGTYDKTKVTFPVCWSEDGITPDDSVVEKQSPTCAKCKNSVKGSKVTEQDKPVVACAEHRMIVVCPAGRMVEDYVMRLKIAITSDWDGRSPEHEAQGWYAFRNYVDFLVSKGVKHTAQLVTKIRFDPNTAYPKLLFAADKWLEGEQVRDIIPIVRSQKVKELVSGTWTPNGADAVPKAEAAATAGAAGTKEAAVDDLAKARAAKEAQAARVKAEQEAAEAKARAAQQAAEAQAKAKAEQEAREAAKAKAAAEEEDDGLGLPEIGGTTKVETKAVPTKGKAAPPKEVKAAATKPKAEPKPVEAPAAEGGDDDALNTLLNDWA